MANTQALWFPAISITDTAPSKLVTQANLPSGVTAAPIGTGPTKAAVITLLLAVSITLTALSSVTVTVT
ncbi:hypothetical protein ACIGBH_39700 [Streptomyces sp. NPDC085929]|uniref:hypothetical protein n=1 Tax=Streptomyces sp. NPDC085929 TaxID=3365739 RepID=UPI0037D09226